MRARWAMSLTAALSILLAGAAGAAHATDPVTLGSGFVVDDADALTPAEEQAAQERLQKLSEDTDVDLWVVYVDTFTDPADAADWANQTADQNGLGPNQYLLAVATESRQFYLSAYDQGPVSPDQVTAIEQQRIQPVLATNDWAGAVDAAADGLEDAVSGGSGGTPTSGGGSGGGFFGGLVVFLVIAAIVGLVVWFIVRRRRRRTGAGAPGQPPAVEQLSTAELASRAASALVQTDDAVKTSEQELGFARAQFGDEAAAEFEQALHAAKEALNEAFTIQQRLDDSEPDTEDQVRAWNARILELCAVANAGLDEKAAAFDELRQLEQQAPEALARVQGERAKAAASLDGAAARLQALATSYAPEALATVADNPEQARQRIAFADEQLAEASAAITEGKGGEAAVGIRAAEDAVGQAQLLEQAIDTLAGDLARGERSAAELIAELEQDLATAGALPDPDGRVAGAVVAVRQQLDNARRDLTAGQKRPLVALEGLEAANQQIDAVVQGVRDAEAQAQRARQVLGQTIMQAQAQVSTAEDYITSRRGAIGATARTRLAEAGAALVQAQQLQSADPEHSLQLAQRANQLAGQAIQAAQSDVGSFPSGGMAAGGSGDGGMLGAVLGGIVINSLLGGGGSGGRGSGGGGLGGMFGGGSSGGRISPGSFGGGGTRSRRGGGRF
ncbi:MAG: TPM domain-containing protein [Microbacterium sp.]